MNLKIKNNSERKKIFLGIAFASPWIIGFLAFVLYPLVMSFYYSFTQYDIINSANFVGFSNYVKISSDELFWKSLYNTLYFVMFSIPLQIFFGVLLAVALNMKVKGQGIYRTLYYMPTVIPIVATSVIWYFLYNPLYGIINGFLRTLGLPEPGWLSDPGWAKISLVIMSLWVIGRQILIYLGGLQDIPEQLYEAADIDGANIYHKFRHITLPMLTPTILFNLITGIIYGFQYFTEPFVMTQGGPLNSTLMYALYLYRNAFIYYKMGIASAMAWILFLIVLFVTYAAFKSSDRWVFYGG